MADAIVNPPEAPMDTLLFTTRKLRALAMLCTGSGVEAFEELKEHDAGEIMYLIADMALKADAAARAVFETSQASQASQQFDPRTSGSPSEIGSIQKDLARMVADARFFIEMHRDKKLRDGRAQAIKLLRKAEVLCELLAELAEPECTDEMKANAEACVELMSKGAQLRRERPDAAGRTA